MPESIKNGFYSVLGMGFWLLMVGVFAAGVIGVAWFRETFSNLFKIVNDITFGVFVLLVIVSVIPRAREFTGNWIVVCSYVFGVLLWLICLVVTYELWGFFGIFLGVIMLGFGIFVTAFIALLMHGEFLLAASILLSLCLIYGARVLGYWIISKYRTREPLRNEPMDTIVSVATDTSDKKNLGSDPPMADGRH